MPITRYPLRDETMMSSICELASNMPLATRHVIDLSWRLSDLDLNEGRDAAIWQESDGMLLAFAACQYPWAVLDFFILPGPHVQTVATQLFAWANQRFQERKWPHPYWVEFREDDQERQQLVRAHGFLDAEEDRYIFFQRTLVDLPPVPVLPDGFLLRTLQGEREVAAYAELHRTAFESTSMTPEWRARTLRMPTYRPELDLVISAPNGELAGFCIGWYEPTRHMAQIEPLGVHPRYQQLGLGRVLLYEMLRRFKEHGAGSALVETNFERTPARHAYESVGFQPVHTIRSIKTWPNQPA